MSRRAAAAWPRKEVAETIVTDAGRVVYMVEAAGSEKRVEVAGGRSEDTREAANEGRVFVPWRFKKLAISPNLYSRRLDTVRSKSSTSMGLKHGVGNYSQVITATDDDFLRSRL